MLLLYMGRPATIDLVCTEWSTGLRPKTWLIRNSCEENTNVQYQYVDLGFCFLSARARARSERMVLGLETQSQLDLVSPGSESALHSAAGGQTSL